MIRLKVPKLGWQLLLAVLMLLMQQGALRHSVQHIAGEEGTVTHAQCKDCLAFHAADQAVASAPLLSLPAPGFAHVLVALPRTTHATPANAGYRSRAPPALLA